MFRRLALACLVTVFAGAVSPQCSGAPTPYKGFPTVDLYVNGKFIQGDVPPLVIDGRTMVPLRLVSEALGEKVWWDGNLRAVAVGKAPVIAGPGVMPDTVKTVQDMAASLWEDTCQFYGIRREMPFIRVFRDNESWREWLIESGASKERADRQAERFIGQVGDVIEIVLSTDEQGRDSWEADLAHVFSQHLLWSVEFRPHLPTWLSEGIAAYCGNEIARRGPTTPIGSSVWAATRDKVLSRAANGTLRPLADGPDEFDELSYEYPAWQHSAAAVGYMVQRWSLPQVKQYLSLVLETGSHEEAFSKTFGVSTVAFKEAFGGYLNEELNRKTGVTVTLTVPEGFRGRLNVFPPGVTEATVWTLEGRRSVKVICSKEGKVTVDAPVAARWRASLGQKPVNLELRVVPEADVKVDSKIVSEQVISIVPGQYGWYWGGNWALWKDSTQDSSFRDPGFPTGIRVITVEPEP